MRAFDRAFYRTFDSRGFEWLLRLWRTLRAFHLWRGALGTSGDFGFRGLACFSRFAAFNVFPLGRLGFLAFRLSSDTIQALAA